MLYMDIWDNGFFFLFLYLFITLFFLGSKVVHLQIIVEK
jgi:hypothetical protein